MSFWNDTEKAYQRMVAKQRLYPQGFSAMNDHEKLYASQCVDKAVSEAEKIAEDLEKVRGRNG